MKLSLRIALLFFSVILLLLVVMGAAFYELSRQFYEDRLLHDVSDRMTAHGRVLEQDDHDGAFAHIQTMEEAQGEVAFVQFSSDGGAVRSSDSLTPADTARYWDWIERSESDAALTEASTHNEPHVYAYHEFETDRADGYLFVDQASGEFAATRETLIYLTGVTTFLGLLLAGGLTMLLTRWITNPLTQIRSVSRRIAQGDFTSELAWKRTDEIGDLSRSIDQMAGRLAAYQASRKRLLANISHDLRTPLTYVKGYSSLLKGKLEADERKQAEVIHREAARMEKLVTDIVDLTKMEEGALSVNPDTIQLCPFLHEIARHHQLLAEETGHRIQVICQKDSTVYADPARLEQALFNLFQNAVRYTPAGTVITWEISCDEIRSFILLQDEGPGIQPDKLPHIWDRFYRADEARSSAVPGSGLGLAIVRQIVLASGGQVAAGNRNGSGAWFRIELPSLTD
ncbi:HAMP domain-containing sensor histidine kinase [Alkalicoccus luteus]|uniref:histidine kinase n=1 Tax=Alkalicoccus luteus TaxID=1237094 RepID=A0A969TV57_9BACI|nr:HAMP domain-containing sensor histidine kinase [Alkalicoccus luteus]NJP37747.1 HAMP domain-containing histidine kinase [Alkalicoccus luteus]